MPERTLYLAADPLQAYLIVWDRRVDPITARSIFDCIPNPPRTVEKSS